MDRLISINDLNRSIIQNQNKSFHETGKNIINPEILILDEHRVKSISRRVERGGSPSTHVVVNIIQKGKEEEQKMVQPSNTVRTPIHINRNLSPKNDKSFNILPLIMNQEPTSPTQRFCFGKRNSISATGIKIQSNNSLSKQNKN